MSDSDANKEMKSFVTHPDYQSLRATLRARLQSWMQETSDIVEMEMDL